MVQPSRTRRALRAVEHTASDAKDQVQTVATGLRRDFDHLSTSVSESAQDAMANMSQRLAAAGLETEALADAAKDRAGRLQEAIADEIQARPLRTLVIAAAVGLVVGLITTR